MTSTGTGILPGLLNTDFSLAMYLSGGKAFRWVSTCWDNPEVLRILRIWETDCLVHSSPSEVKSEHSRTSMFGISIFRYHPFCYCFSNFSWLVPTEWNGTTRLRAWWVGCRSSPHLLSVRAVSLSVAVEFHCLRILRKWLRFNDFVPFILPESVCVFKQ